MVRLGHLSNQRYSTIATSGSEPGEAGPHHCERHRKYLTMCMAATPIGQRVRAPERLLYCNTGRFRRVVQLAIVKHVNENCVCCLLCSRQRDTEAIPSRTLLHSRIRPAEYCCSVLSCQVWIARLN
ncbi:hypothetical protein PINS_up010041 [Pythium insidiosum]|nr:hypothetical protein PINS_up010041 [Pythium insidiosum]